LSISVLSPENKPIAQVRVIEQKGAAQKLLSIEASLGGKFIGSLKRGSNMNIVGIDQARKQAGFKVTLSGFTAAYDGEAVDPKTLQEQNETLQQKLQRKADEKNRRLSPVFLF